MPLHLAVWVVVAGFLAGSRAVPAASRVAFVTYGFALIAFVLLSVTFSCGPLGRRGGSALWKALLARQRALGVYSFLVIASHIACLWNFKYQWSFAKATGDGFHWIAFTLLHAAFLVLFAMFLTSNDAAVRALGPGWKRLHRLGLLAYAVIALGVLGATAKTPSLRLLFPVCLALALGVLAARLSERKSHARG